MLLYILALLASHPAQAQNRFQAAKPCVIVRDEDRSQIYYCLEPRTNNNTGLCAKLPNFEPGSYCVVTGRVGEPLFPQPSEVPAHEISQVIDLTLFVPGMHKAGEETMLPDNAWDNSRPTPRLEFVRTADLPWRQLPAPPEVQAREVREQAARVRELPKPPAPKPPAPKPAAPKPAAPTPAPPPALSARANAVPSKFQRDWLEGIPPATQTLIKTWLVKESATCGRTNLANVAEKARIEACEPYLDEIIGAYKAEKLPKVAALALIEENECRADRVSVDDAVGFCQILQDTGTELGLTTYPVKHVWKTEFVKGKIVRTMTRVPDPRDDRLDPHKCIPAAARYVRKMIDQQTKQGCTGTPIMKGLMAYNAGQRLIKKRVCPFDDARTMAWPGEAGNYLNRTLGMAYALDADLQGDEVPSTLTRLTKAEGGACVTTDKAIAIRKAAAEKRALAAEKRRQRASHGKRPPQVSENLPVDLPVELGGTGSSPAL